MGSMFLGKIILAQIVGCSIVVYVLKRVLDGMLIDLAIRHFEFGFQSRGCPPETQVKIITHKKLKMIHHDKVMKVMRKHFGPAINPEFLIDKKILGGMILRINDECLDFSLKDRLSQAFPRK